MLVGVLDPSHKEADLVHLGRKPNWFTLDDALEQAYDNPKWSPWTWELMHAMFEEFQERGSRISASALVSHCPRSEIIKRRADYLLNLNDLYVPFKGTMVHRTLELYAHPGAIAEARFYTDIDGIEVSCAPDLLTRTTLYDYKFTSKLPVYNSPYTGHKEQVEINAYIVRNYTHYDLPSGVSALPFDPHDFPPQHVVLVYLGPDAPKILEVESTDDIFDAKTGKFGRGKVPLIWSDQAALKVLRPRVEMFQRALDCYPEWPKGAEAVWGGEATWDCPGFPLCRLPNCLAKRWPNGLVWEKP